MDMRDDLGVVRGDLRELLKVMAAADMRETLGDIRDGLRELLVGLRELLTVMATSPLVEELRPKECRPSHNLTRTTRGSVLDELGDKELVKNGAKERRPSLPHTTRGSVLDELGDEDDQHE